MMFIFSENWSVGSREDGEGTHRLYGNKISVTLKFLERKITKI